MWPNRISWRVGKLLSKLNERQRKRNRVDAEEDKDLQKRKNVSFKNGKMGIRRERKDLVSIGLIALYKIVIVTNIYGTLVSLGSMYCSCWNSFNL